MTKQPVDEQTITDYLLGALPDSENERLDEMSLSDDEFVEQLNAVENDLVDAYARGELSEQTIDRFRSHYLVSAKRKEKVQFAQAFQNRINKSSANRTVGASSKARFIFPAAPRVILQWGFAAAALILLLVGTYFIMENLQLRNQIAQSQAEQALLKKREQDLQRRLQQSSPRTETNAELNRARQRLAQLEQQLAARENQPEERDVKLVAFNLAPQTRGAGKMKRLPIAADIEAVAFTLELETNDFPEYQVQLKDPATGKPLWHTGKIKVGADSTAVPVRLPASLLKAQNYLLEVSGTSNTGVSEIVSSYPFNVVKQ